MTRATTINLVPDVVSSVHDEGRQYRCSKARCCSECGFDLDPRLDDESNCAGICRFCEEFV